MIKCYMRYNLGFELNNVVATPVILNQKYIRLSTCDSVRAQVYFKIVTTKKNS